MDIGDSFSSDKVDYSLPSTAKVRNGGDITPLLHAQ
jgi:hypothetical protein